MHVPVIPHAEGGLTRIKAILDYTVKAKIAPPPKILPRHFKQKKTKHFRGSRHR